MKNNIDNFEMLFEEFYCDAEGQDDSHDFDPFEPDPAEAEPDPDGGLYCYGDAYSQDYEDRLLEEYKNNYIEKKTFDSVPKCGYHASAYRDDLDNQEIINLRVKGYSLRKIANILGCSPSTVRNRLNKMGI